MKDLEKRERITNALIHYDRKLLNPQEICNKIFDYMIPGYYCTISMHSTQCNTELLTEMECIYRHSIIRASLLGSGFRFHTIKQIQDLVYDMTDKKDYGICPPALEPLRTIIGIDDFFLGGYSTWSERLNLHDKKYTVNEKIILTYEYLKLEYKNSMIRKRYGK